MQPHVSGLGGHLQKVRDSLVQIRDALASWDPVIFRGTFGQALGLDDLPQIRGALWRLASQDLLLGDKPVNDKSERERVTDAITHFTDVLDALRSMADTFSLDIVHLDNLLGLFSGPNLAGPTPVSAVSGRLTALSRAARTMGRTRTLGRAALFELSRIADPRLKRMVRTWLDILATRPDLRPPVRGVRNAMILTELLLDLRRERQHGTAGSATETKLRGRIRELSARDQAVRDRLGRELSSEELAGLGVGVGG